MVMMVVVSADHDDGVVPMPVSLTDPNADAAYVDAYTFRNDHGFIAGGRRTGKSRHRQKRH